MRSPLAPNLVSCLFQAQYHHEQLPSCSGTGEPGMLTRPQPHQAEAKATTHEAEATTHEAEATTHEAEAKTHLEILIII